MREVDINDLQEASVVTVDERGEEMVHHARFLIDASGQDALVGTKNGWRKPREELDRTALWSHWTGVEMTGGLEEGLSLIIYMGEEKRGWIWVFPLEEDRVTAGVVMQNSYIREQRRALQERGSTDWKLDLTMQELLLSPFVESLLKGTRRVLPIMVNGDYSYEVKNHYATNYAMIGDARGFIDRIFSSGVFLSMKTAYLVSDAVHAKLSSPSGDGAARLAEAYRRVTGAYDFVHRMIRLFYNPHAITWAEIGAEGQVHRRHESAMAAGHYMLAGDFFENHERHNKFFELLENPDGFRYYKVLVVDRSHFNDLSCHTPRDLAFGHKRRSSQGVSFADVGAPDGTG